MMTVLLVFVQSVRVDPSLRFAQNKASGVGTTNEAAPPTGCYVILDTGSSKTEPLIETGVGTKIFVAGDKNARIDCVLAWDAEMCCGTEKTLEKLQECLGFEGHKTLKTQHITKEEYQKQVLDNIWNNKTDSCTKF